MNFKQNVLSCGFCSVFFYTEVWLTLPRLESFTVYKSLGDFLFAKLSAMALAWATQQGEKVGKSKRLRIIGQKEWIQDFTDVSHLYCLFYHGSPTLPPIRVVLLLYVLWLSLWLIITVLSLALTFVQIPDSESIVCCNSWTLSKLSALRCTQTCT